MEFPLLHVVTFFSAVVILAAAVDPEGYWNSELPNTAMPNVFQDLLHPEWMEEKGTSVSVEKGGVNVGVGKPGGKGTHVGVGKGGVGVSTGGHPGGRKGANVGVGKGGVAVHTGRKGHPVNVRVAPIPKSPFLYNYAATEDQLHDNPNVAVFFLEKDLHKGSQMNLQFTKSTENSATFLPRKFSDWIPFSTSKFPEILNKLSVKPNSEEAKIMEKTIKECEEPGIEGEEKYCATSLESMIDFSTSKLGKNVKVVSTEIEKETQLQKFRIEDVEEINTDSNKAVVCHKQEYAYAVFYCHKTTSTSAFMVSLVGTSDGTKAKAVAVCHKNTSAWNPKHLAFQMLKIKPGTVPVCHFLPQDHVVWVAK